MIISKSDKHPYLTRFSDGTHEGLADTIPEKGGGNCGFRPHALLEAALASCINMTVRMYADEHHLPLEQIITTVSLIRSTEGIARFTYQVELAGNLDAQQKGQLIEVAAKCPVHKTLSQKIDFERVDNLIGIT